MKTIGERIREFRGKTSREVFASVYNIHPNTLRRYEMDERTPDPDFLKQLEGEEGWVKNEADTDKIEEPLKAHPSDDAPSPLEREVVLLREMLALQKENGDLRVRAAQLEARNAELERQLADALKPAPLAPLASGMSRAG